MKTKHPEILQVPADLEKIACDGGGGALGHPRVWYTFGVKDSITCRYCDRFFTKKTDVKGAKPLADIA